MNLIDLSNLATIIGILITLFGILILYFGRIILKSRKEITKDTTSEILLGSLFLIDCLVIPAVIVYVLYIVVWDYLIPLIFNNQGTSLLNLLYVVVGGSLIMVQYFLIGKYYERRLNSQQRTDRYVNYLSSIFIIVITIFFIFEKDWFYLISSFVLDFLIYTYMASRDHFREDNNHRDGNG